MPTAFSQPDVSGITYHDYHLHPNEKIWLGLPVLTVRVGLPVRITGVKLVDALPTSYLAFVDAPLLGTNDGEHVTIVSDAELKEFNYQIAGPLKGAVFRPGPPTHYGLVGLAISQPGEFAVDAFEIDYATGSGRVGRQVVHQSFKFRVR